MSLRRLTGSHHSSRHAAVSPAWGAFAARRQAHSQMTDSIQAYPPREQNGSARHQQQRQGDAGRLPENRAATNGAYIDRPCFPRLHASIAERQLDWGWQQCPDSASPSGESLRNEPGSAGKGLSARALWLGGVAFALLAAGMISALATFQSSRPLPFEAWARSDLIQRAGSMPGAMARDAIARGHFVGAPESELTGRAGHDPIAALLESGAARGGAAATPASASADREPADADAALASDARLEPFDLEVAVLGPILASAATADKLAVNLAVSRPSRSTAGIHDQGLLPEPPRPVFKPTLVSSSSREPVEAARPRPRP